MKCRTVLSVLLSVWFSACWAQTRGGLSQQLLRWQVGSAVTDEAARSFGIEKCFVQMPVGDAVFARMQGRSFPKDCRIKRSDLRYLHVLHYDFDGRVRLGELVCNRQIAADLVSIFRELYEHQYPIQSVRLIDDFEADDEQSMRANNTSAFCYRQVKGSTMLSLHSQGRAIDINPLYNPCVRRGRDGRFSIQPQTARKYVDRKASFAHKIDRNDLLYRLFMSHGFRWGGAWRTVKDYQHFEK